MFAIIGIVVVFGCVVAGYLMEHGNLRVLMQPAELIIILGAAIGTVLIANPLHILAKIGKGIGSAFGGSPFTKQRYMDSLRIMYELFSRARKEGLMSLEADSDAPDQSTIFSKYPKFLKDHHALAFVCDALRMAASGGIEPFDADQMMELDMEVHHHQATLPVAALSTMADSLPGLGIVAAVLGVVITMGALGGATGRDRQEGGGRIGGNVSRDPAVLWLDRPPGGEHGQARGRGERVLPRIASNAGGLTERHIAERCH
jgi:chemotaxis protein MotA